MPPQKRLSENLDEDSQQRHHHQHQPQQQQQHQEHEDEEGGGEDSDGSLSSSDGEEDEFITVKLSEIRKEVQCPICLGIIRKTRTVMECLHRFCRECIDKSMRLGNNECPACRTHCASRRSLRDDPNYDALIAALYPDIDKYEEEELAFREEEKTLNKQIQASIAQTFRRQSEALGKRRATAKAMASYVRKSQGQYRRGRSSRNTRVTELQVSDDDEDGNGNEGGGDSSSDEECRADVKQKRYRRWSGPRSAQPSSAAANADGGHEKNDDFEVGRESTGASPGRIGNPEVLAWGKGGVRSHTRYGSINGSNGKNGRNNRLAKVVDHLRIVDENDNKSDVHVTLVSLDEQRFPSLQRPYLCCPPTLSIRHLCQYVSQQTLVQAEEVEMLVVREPSLNPSNSTNDLIPKVDLCNDKLQILEAQETLAGLQANCTSSRGHLVMAYRQKAFS